MKQTVSEKIVGKNTETKCVCSSAGTYSSFVAKKLKIFKWHSWEFENDPFCYVNRHNHNIDCNPKQSDISNLLTFIS